MCLPSVFLVLHEAIAHDKISQAFPLHITESNQELEAVKAWEQG